MAALFRSSLLLQRTSTIAPTILSRNIGMSGVVWAKMDKNSDPIQRLFVEKIQSYKQKSKNSGKLFGVTPEIEAEIEKEMGQIKRRFGGGNLEEFPKFDFAEK
ncbi:ATP synthase-coupling factor 6, mitochondrial-like [Actinia tenebrosa]|uniref:ATP synthase-coupling factor 6, mitochondrial-like n=1 Tax=Actinia tenebrosa TaxID=6105 RepID=A0A6P8HWS3_ACTTE|nr:ATP synthase-coupling factor 6, mitochondrial-like [Actinia tenebrosa]